VHNIQRLMRVVCAHENWPRFSALGLCHPWAVGFFFMEVSPKRVSEQVCCGFFVSLLSDQANCGGEKEIVIFKVVLLYGRAWAA